MCVYIYIILNLCKYYLPHLGLQFAPRLPHRALIATFVKVTYVPTDSWCYLWISNILYNQTKIK